ncbi:hypothetical protein OG814_32215 [Streptomyces zaomyceticus]|uniref:BZIP domain-containing protein n=1 Tax=Streptomyces zaomyceticus TaxID=68286 RepID=A0ABZ1LHY6_9ACTN
MTTESPMSSPPLTAPDHVGMREQDATFEKDGIEAPDAVEEAGSSKGKSGKRRVATGVCLGALATAVGVLAWRIKELAAENDELKSRNKELAAENGELKSMASELLVRLAELVTENEYLKSASGAGRTLNGHRGH